MPTPPLYHPPVTQVYRAETQSPLREMDKGEILLGSIIRTSERNRRLFGEPDEEEEEEEVGDEGEEEERNDRKRSPSPSAPSPVPPEINLSTQPTAGGSPEIERRLEQCHLSSVPARTRCFSESVLRGKEKEAIAPLDLSFDNDDEEDGEKVSAWYRNSQHYSGRSLDTASDGEDEEEEEEAEDVSGQEHREGHANAVPSPVEMATFRKSLVSAASMVFHQHTGLPLTSSPAPLRRGNTKFDFDDSIHTPHDIKRALFRAEGPKSPVRKIVRSRRRVRTSGGSNCSSGSGAADANNNSSNNGLSASAPATVTSSNLLGSFEESVLNGRLEPVSTVEGFTAEIGASGSFHPKHKTLPVTVFFYTLCDHSSISSPYLGKGTFPLLAPVLQ